MSKIIRLTPELIDQCKREFEDSLIKAKKEFEDELGKNKIAGGKIDFSFGKYTKSFSSSDRKATLYFTEKAWIKMTTLLREFSTEVAWHGVATRGDDESRDEYFIHDIIVYPQEVTGGTVNTDQEKYQEWLYSLSDEEFDNLRMQGHSHVNMSTSPSSVDLQHQEKLLDQLEGDMFYIFMIWNKSLSKDIRIYDMKKNVLFETADVECKIIEGDLRLMKFISDAKEMCKTRSFQNVNQYKQPEKKQEIVPAKQLDKYQFGSKDRKPAAPANSSGKAANSTSYDDYDEDEEWKKYMSDPFYARDGWYGHGHYYC